MLSKKKGSGDYLKWKIKWFNEKRKNEIEEEKKKERKQFLKENKKISFYIRKDILKKIEEITDDKEKFINDIIIKHLVDKGCL